MTLYKYAIVFGTDKKDWGIGKEISGAHHCQERQVGEQHHNTLQCASPGKGKIIFYTEFGLYMSYSLNFYLTFSYSIYS